MNASTNSRKTTTASFCTAAIATLAFATVGFAQSSGTGGGPDTNPGPVGDRPTPQAGPFATNGNTARPKATDKAGATASAYTYDQILTASEPPRDEFPPNETDQGPVSRPEGDVPDEGKPEPTFPDQRVDWNADKFVTVTDLLSFVSEYFAGKPGADVTDDGEITSIDLLTYLNWFFQAQQAGSR